MVDLKQQNTPGAASPTSGQGSAWPQPNLATQTYQWQGRTLNLGEDQWKKEKETEAQNWGSTPWSRFLKRCFSRGIMGAAAYAVANRYAREALREYHPDNAVFAQKWWKIPAHATAKFYDTAFGVPIRSVAQALGKTEHEAQLLTTFRRTGREASGIQREVTNHKNYGRSLGDEVVRVTADFAAMSVADAIGRDVLNTLDPNVKKDWIKDGKVDYGKLAEHVGWNTVRYLTYNAGEDWAVAVPYVYFMKKQRHLLNKLDPGFIYDAERGLNGASMKVDDHGKTTGGTYHLTGLLDIQSRFTAYNIGTLMFREAYAKAAQDLTEISHHGVSHSLPDLTPGGIAKSAVSLAKWTLRDIVKGAIVMTPSVPFLSITRVPQMKTRGLFINPEKGVLTYEGVDDKGNRKYDYLHNDELGYREKTIFQVRKVDGSGNVSEATPLYFRKFEHNALDWTGYRNNQNQEVIIPNYYDQQAGKNVHEGTAWKGSDSFFNQISRMMHAARKCARTPVRNYSNTIGYNWNKDADWIAHPERYDDDELRKKKKLVHGIHILRDGVDQAVNAAIAYTPYFWAKTEFAQLYDNARTDVAIERMVDALGTLNVGEFSAGIGELGKALQRTKFQDKEREAYVQYRLATDHSAADVLTPDFFQAAAKHVEVKKKTNLPENMSFDEWKSKTATTNGTFQLRLDELNKPRVRESFVQQVRPAENPAPASWQSREKKSLEELRESRSNAPRAASFTEMEHLRTQDQIAPPGAVLH